MSKRKWELYLEDIIECIQRIEEYIGKMSYETLKNDNKTIDAVMRNLEVIGEASKNIPDGIKNRYADIPWRDITDFRNRAIHEYFGISLEIIWKIITQELPRLKERIRKIAVD